MPPTGGVLNPLGVERPEVPVGVTDVGNDAVGGKGVRLALGGFAGFDQSIPLRSSMLVLLLLK